LRGPGPKQVLCTLIPQTHIHTHTYTSVQYNIHWYTCTNGEKTPHQDASRKK
jgi:hypothetical protein